ncbi:hemin uptake protein HemP [Guyparkeria sp. 1SP6A2]|nr:hemin uptake protein HemP [Guyparkeria sp. 1SP6A2]
MHQDRPPSALPTGGAPQIDSDRLLGPDGQIWIRHASQWYLLRTTAANKLILTK